MTHAVEGDHAPIGGPRRRPGTAASAAAARCHRSSPALPCAPRLRPSDLQSDGLLDRARERRDLRRECELDGLVPRHRSSFVEGSAGSLFAEPGTGWAEVALAPGLGERWGMGHAELLPF